MTQWGLCVFKWVLLIISWLSYSLLVHGQIVWQLNYSFSIQASSPSFPHIYEPNLTIYPFFPEIQQVISILNNASSSSTAFIFPCFVEAPANQSSGILSSTMFALCMNGVAPYQVLDGPLQSAPAIIWIANPDAPARGKNISLIFQHDGDLVLRGDANKGAAWRSNTTAQGVTKMEISQSPANLILYDSSNRIVWQSMDYPVDTISFGQSLKEGMKLVSRTLADNMSKGEYSLEINDSQQLTLLYKKHDAADSIPYWIWPSDSFPYKKPDTISPKRLPFAAFITSEGLSVGHLINNQQNKTSTVQGLAYSIPEDHLQNTFLRLYWDGTLRLYSIKENWDILADLFSDENGCLLPQSCGSYGVCIGKKQCKCPDVSDATLVSSFVALDPNDLTKGCGPTQPLPSCNNTTIAAGTLGNTLIPHLVQMQLLEGVAYFSPIPSYVSTLNVSNFNDKGYNCSELCLHNCTCLAALWNVNLSECIHISQQQMGSFRGGLNKTNYQAYLKVSILPLVPNIPYPHQNNMKKVVIGVSIGIGAFSIACISLFFIYCKGSQTNASIYRADDVLGDTALSKLPARFSYNELQAATNGFSHKLGKGGFGTVYAGTLADGMTRVAVKKLEGMRQGEKEFKTELAIMAGIHHQNLLQLMGYCAEGAERRLLVYKFMENGSLDQWLFASSSASLTLHNRTSSSEDIEEKAEPKLKWGLRNTIAIGVAKGLAYLHEGCEKRIIHLDIKPQNILLDESFVAKVADFGLSRGMEREESHVVTIMRGTPGYLAPEWLKDGAIDVKCDVFSFGMLLMEIVSGRKNVNMRQTEAPFYPKWAYSQIVANKLFLGTAASDNSYGLGYIMSESHHDRTRCTIDGLTDAKLESEQERAQLQRLVITAFLCMLERPEWRPPMGIVVQMMEGHIPVSHIDLSSLYHGLSFVLQSNDVSGSPASDKGSTMGLRREFQEQLQSILALSSAPATASYDESRQLSGR